MLRRATVTLVVLIAATCVAGAAEVVKFKNGHTMVVKESRVEGSTLLVTLADGSVLGFPLDLVIAPPEQSALRVLPGRANRAKAGGGRGPRGEELLGYRRQKGSDRIGEGSLSAADATSRFSRQVGFYRPREGETPTQEVRRQKGGYRVTDLIDFAEGRRKSVGSGQPGAFVPPEGAPERQLPQQSMRPAKAFTRSGKPIDDR